MPTPAPPPSPAEPDARPRRSWLEIREAGSLWGLRFVVWLFRLAGRRVTRGFVAIIIFYYAVFRPSARAASRAYLERLGRPHAFWDTYRHLLRFGQVTVDRLLILTGRAHDHLHLDTRGDELIFELIEGGRGGILLGAHLGSFEALRMRCRDYDVAIHVLGDFRNAQRVNTVLDHLSPDHRTRVIDVPPGNPAGLALKLKDLIEAGEIVAMLGDRAAPHLKTAEVDFLGGRARLPVGPYALAAVLRCPIVLVFGLHFPPDRYLLVAEPFAERVELPRKGREEAMQAYAQRFADRLAHRCREAPENWFNFYDFWSGG